MALDRRQMLITVAAGLAAGAHADVAMPRPAPVRRHPDGSVDWKAVRDLFPLARDWVHLANLLLVSHPAPVAAAIEHFRRRIDADPYWLELAALTDSEGRPFDAVKRSLAEYTGGTPAEICLTSNTTSALAIAYHGLIIRADHEILTTTHEHFSHHESMRYAAARSGCAIRTIPLYERSASATAGDMVDRLARAIGPRTRAVGVTWVHSSTGVKLPIPPIAEAVARANRGRAAADRCLLIVDGVHGFGNQDVDVARLGCDFFASGAHKWLLAPRGTGFLWGRADVWPEIRPTIPSFDPDGIDAAWGAWMEDRPMPTGSAAVVSPGGFLAYEHLLAIPAAVGLHREIGRDRIAARIAELNGAFREGAAGIPGVTLHTPRDPSLSGGISCFEVAGMTAEEVATRLAAAKFRTSNSPYRTPYPRVCAGIVNFPEEIDAVLGAIRALAGR